MNRFAIILGFAVLAVAATMTVMISMRNAPESSCSEETRGTVADPAGLTKRLIWNGSGGVRSSEVSSHTDNEENVRVEGGFSRAGSSAARPIHSARRPLHVALDQRVVSRLSDVELAGFRKRALEVEHLALARLDELTVELDLSVGQREKIFPMLLAAMPGFEPGMAAGGKSAVVSKTRTGIKKGATEVAASEGTLASDESVEATATDIHAELEPGQQVLFEDSEVDRQLWWQSVIGRLENELIDDTGGAEIEEGLPVEDATEREVPENDTDREAPEGHGSSNLFDLIGS